MPRIVQPLGAAIVVKVFTFLVEGCSWTGRVAKHERLVVGILTYPRPELFGHVTIRAADIEDAESILLNTPQRKIARRSFGNDLCDILRSQSIRTRDVS